MFRLMTVAFSMVITKMLKKEIFIAALLVRNTEAYKCGVI
jgi:hypothetical protein